MKAIKPISFWQSMVLIITVLTTLILVNLAIVDKEQHLANGQELLLKMVPVDPRSLMQGDYMRVRFAIEEDIKQHFGDSFALDGAVDGVVLLGVDKHNIGRFEQVADVGTATANNQMAVRFRIRNGVIKFATGSFFFQEGKAAQYEKAQYGVFKVNDKGEPLLTDLVVGP